MIKIAICDTAPEGACSYYRSIGVLSHLRKINPEIYVEYVPVFGWSHLMQFDVLFVGRPMEAHIIKIMEMARELGVKTWIDYDDCLHEIPKDNPAYDEVRVRFPYIEQALKLADAVTVSTPVMKGYYQKITNANIVVIENAFNDYNYEFDYVEKNVDFINWRGSATHRQDLLSCVRAMHDVSESYPNWAWTFIGNDIWYVLDGIKNHFHLRETDIISYHKFIKELRPAIQIVPLLGNKFTESKSNIAWIEGTWSGAATLAPTLSEFKKPGCINYKAEDNESFKYYLEKMINSKKLRREKYDESYEYIKNNLMLSKVNQKRLEILESLIVSPKSKPIPKSEEIKVMKFKDSELAHKYCKGKGIELGAASHNPFNLEDCINVAPELDEKFYSESQKDMGEEPQKIDIYGTADVIPVEDHSYDYIISSHVVEHVPDIIGAFLEWNRVLKDEGIIFIIAPKRDALPKDIGRPLSEIEEFDAAHIPENRGTVETEIHVWVFSMIRMVELIKHCNEKYNLGWDVIETLETDDKVGNGHCIVCKKAKV